MKIEKNKTTTYTPAKNKMGCSAPIGDTDLFFIRSWFSFSKVWINHQGDTLKVVFSEPKLFVNLV